MAPLTGSPLSCGLVPPPGAQITRQRQEVWLCLDLAQPVVAPHRVPHHET